ncbi:C40 family peptidase [Zhihengliuella halotolerans]|uniref:C40 family peptidase n=1 Tax=Zhihengliuella halotolerans TaxID=370736 RepID=UPI000C80FF70|nr:C40 family peptidase [Zhihengliuella halotolerans]
MAQRHPLPVAFCALALVAGASLSGTTASASPQTGQLASVLGTSLPASPIAAAKLPTTAEVKAAKEDPAALQAMVERVESLIFDASHRVAEAEVAALSDQESATAAQEVLAERNAAAEDARRNAKAAEKYYEESQEAVGQLAGDLYRNAGVNPAVSALLTQSDSNDVLYKTSTMTALASNRARTLATADEAANLWSAWKDYAAACEQAAEEAAGISAAALEEAEREQASYEAALAEQERSRDELIGRLATLRETTAREEAERIEAREAEEREQQLAQAREQVPEIVPAAVPEPAAGAPAVPTPPPAVPDSEPAPSVITRPTPTKTPTPAPTQAPSPDVAPPTQTATPKPAPTKTAAPKPTKTATPKPSPTKTAAPKPAPTKTATPKPKPTKTAAPAPAPKPKPTPKPTPPPAPAPAPGSGSSAYEPAISWAVNIANDDRYTYLYGGNPPWQFDCSLFTQGAFRQGGVSLPRTSTQQYHSAPVKVPLSQLKRGDLVFSTSNGGSSFYHVAIYMGNGQVVHARNPSAGISVTPLSWVNNIHSYGVRY